MKFVTSLAFQDPLHATEVARTADACGWDGLIVSDHVVHPEKIESPYPYTKDAAPRWEAPAPWPDPWVTIGAMAAGKSARDAVVIACEYDCGSGLPVVSEALALRQAAE